MTHSIDKNTHTNEPAPRKPLRLWPGIVAAVLLVLVRFLVPIVVDESHADRDDGRGRRRAGDSPVVAVLQPRALVRTPGRHRADDRRAVRDLAPRPRVDYRRRDGRSLFYVWAIPTLGVALVASVAASRRLSSRIPPRVDRCGDPARVRSVDAHANRRRHQRHRRFGLPLAMDADSRATAPGSGRRQSAGAAAGRGSGDSEGTSRDQGGRQSSRAGRSDRSQAPATTPEPARRQPRA